jgi:hypothetical protein
VSGAAERVGLEDLAGLQRTGDITDAGAHATETYREFGRGLRIGGDGGKAADHVPDRAGADGIQQVPAQSPRQRLLPNQRHRGRLSARRLRLEMAAPAFANDAEPWR